MVATTDREDFVRLTDPYRRELLAHCYRMLGSVDEAEDLVQETCLRAWRSYDGYEGRASLRTWLHRIATNTCLTALEGRARRPLPTGLGEPSQAPEEPLSAPVADVPWLQPLPDALVDPASVAAARGSLRLALVAALQHLPARQRAVLILRDVLEPSGAADREVLDRYVAAFENADMDALLALLRDGVELEMPPFQEWFRGAKDVHRFLVARLHCKGTLRMLPTRANGQPGAAMYVRGEDGVLRPHSVQVLTVEEGAVGRITAFLDGAVIGRFGLPGELR
ncbi:RNA polymerase subunit sigma-70 [Streptomyces sp. NPDC052415]|uniref:RNA polymerase subunit sigma-70 n=1 Tax=Streptomyces sp. NPDC052415 TaxID=3365690 RepID=UPI0037CDA326